MVVVLFRSLEGENLEDFSIRLAQQWRIGQKGLDNGVILLVFLNDRKLRFEIGYGLEGAIPDAEAGRIIRDVIGPRFREQRYAAGLEAAVDAVFARVEGKPAPARDGRPSPAGNPVWWMLGIFFVIAVLLLHELGSPRRRAPRNAWTAGRRGWYAPTTMYPWWGSGRGGGWSSRGGGGGGFSGGGGSFGGGGASGRW